jgi:ssDNA-binding Zn-finger/Zn-ribbon topoisomerase 1
MVLRTARNGPNSGGQFWGCAGFPRCRATKPAA